MDVSALLEETVCQCLLHNCECTNSMGEVFNGHVLTENKIIALYFTSNWCEPCHTFTALLRQISELPDKKLSEIVIINVPIETEAEEAERCFQHMPSCWYMIPSTSQQTKLLANKFGIRTIPRLVVCKTDGTALTMKGRSEVETKHSLALYSWIEMAHAKPKQLLHGFDLDDEDITKQEV